MGLNQPSLARESRLDNVYRGRRDKPGSMAGRWLAPVLMGVLILVAGSAQAAQSSLEIDVETPDPIRPGETVTIPATVEYTYSGDGSSDGDVRISLVPSIDRLASIIVRPQERNVPVDDNCQCATADFTLEISMSGDAEAFDHVEALLTARSDDSGDVDGSSTEQHMPVTSAYVPDFRLRRPDDPVVVSGEVTHVRPIGVNQANGPVQAQMKVTDLPSGIQAASPPSTGIAHEPDRNTTTFDVILLRGDNPTTGTMTFEVDYWAQGRTDTLRTSNPVTVPVEIGPGILFLGAIVGVAVVAVGIGVWWFRYR